jgi:hypothetical protein
MSANGVMAKLTGKAQKFSLTVVGTLGSSETTKGTETGSSLRPMVTYSSANGVTETVTGRELTPSQAVGDMLGNSGTTSSMGRARFFPLISDCCRMAFGETASWLSQTLGRPQP